MFRENDYQAMKFLIEEDRENILNALGLFEKKKVSRNRYRCGILYIYIEPLRGVSDTAT